MTTIGPCCHVCGDSVDTIVDDESPTCALCKSFTVEPPRGSLMPSASNESHELMLKWFNHPVSDHGPMCLLMSHGFTEVRGMIYPPVPSHTVNYIEVECLRFLIHEWDYAYAHSNIQEGS